MIQQVESRIAQREEYLKTDQKFPQNAPVNVYSSNQLTPSLQCPSPVPTLNQNFMMEESKQATKSSIARSPIR